MQRLISRLREEAERGASAIIVALVLLVLVGFTGLGVDVTSAYAKSQEIQNAADAAALGTAQYCAQPDVTCTDGSEAGRATGLARENVRLQTGTVFAQDSYEPPAAPNQVTVAVTGEHQNYFAGVFGFDSFTVNREATARWLTITSGPATLPLTISARSFFTIAGEPIVDQTVHLWLSKGKDTFAGESDVCAEGYPPGGFGWLPADAECQTEVHTPGDILVSDPGADRPSCVDLEMLQLGKVFLIPIFDDYETFDTGNNARYVLLRFAAVRLESYRFQEGGPTIQNGTQPACPPSTRPTPTSDYRNSCLRVRFVEWVELGDEYEGEAGGAPGVTLIRLVEP